jgi:hypothetical protein
MEIVKLQAGQSAPTNSDSIRIDHSTRGKYSLIGSALLNCGDSEQAESVSIVASETYDTVDQAHDAGVAWASAHCVKQLFVECPE